MNQSFSKIWIVIILVTLIAGTILVYQYGWVQKERTEPEIIKVPTDWKIYTNRIHGYQFSYPPNWKIEESIGKIKSKGSINISCGADLKNDEEDISISIGFSDKDIQEASAQKKHILQESFPSGVKEEIISIIGVRGIKLTYGIHSEIFIPKNKKLLHFTISVKDPQK